jgi:hypothetical protein
MIIWILYRYRNEKLRFTGRSVEALGFLIPMFDSPLPKGYYLNYAYEHALYLMNLCLNKTYFRKMCFEL